MHSPQAPDGTFAPPISIWIVSEWASDPRRLAHYCGTRAVPSGGTWLTGNFAGDSGCRTGSFQIRTPRLRWPTLPAVGARARGPAKQILSCSDSLNQFAKFLARLEEGNLLRWHFDSGAA